MKHSSLRKASEQALLNYEDRKEEIQKLLKEIAAGLEEHDRKASLSGGHHWGHVGDLNQVAEELSDIRNKLMGKGEYAEPAETGHHHRSLSRRKLIKAALS